MALRQQILDLSSALADPAAESQRRPCERADPPLPLVDRLDPLYHSEGRSPTRPRSPPSRIFVIDRVLRRLRLASRRGNSRYFVFFFAQVRGYARGYSQASGRRHRCLCGRESWARDGDLWWSRPASLPQICRRLSSGSGGKVACVAVWRTGSFVVTRPTRLG